MVKLRAQPSSTTEGAHLILYDGVCGLCSRLVQFVLRHDHRRVFRFASLQSATGQTMVARSGGNPRELTSLFVFADYDTRESRVFARSDAALFVAGELRWPWKAAVLGRVLPKNVRDGLYDLVARTRYRVFRRSEQCLIPRPVLRNRFID